MRADLSPADQLAAARSRVVGPYLPAKPEWLEGWIGPIRWQAVASGPMRIGAWGSVGSSSETPTWGIVTSTDGHDRSYSIYFDVRRPEVRDHLVRLGCPAWARDVPAAVWCWGMGVLPLAVLGMWDERPSRHRFHYRLPLFGTRVPGGYQLVHEAYEGNMVGDECVGFSPLGASWRTCGKGERAPWSDCMAACDLAALRAGCILREPGGWLVPLPGVEVGFFPEAAA